MNDNLLACSGHTHTHTHTHTCTYNTHTCTHTRTQQHTSCYTPNITGLWCSEHCITCPWQPCCRPIQPTPNKEHLGRDDKRPHQPPLHSASLQLQTEHPASPEGLVHRPHQQGRAEKPGAAACAGGLPSGNRQGPGCCSLKDHGRSYPVPRPRCHSHLVHQWHDPSGDGSPDRRQQPGTHTLLHQHPPKLCPVQ